MITLVQNPFIHSNDDEIDVHIIDTHNTLYVQRNPILCIKVIRLQIH